MLNLSVDASLTLTPQLFAQFYSGEGALPVVPQQVPGALPPPATTSVPAAAAVQAVPTPQDGGESQQLSQSASGTLSPEPVNAATDPQNTSHAVSPDVTQPPSKRQSAESGGTPAAGPEDPANTSVISQSDPVSSRGAQGSNALANSTRSITSLDKRGGDVGTPQPTPSQLIEKGFLEACDDDGNQGGSPSVPDEQPPALPQTQTQQADPQPQPQQSDGPLQQTATQQSLASDDSPPLECNMSLDTRGQALVASLSLKFASWNFDPADLGQLSIADVEDVLAEYKKMARIVKPLKTACM